MRRLLSGSAIATVLALALSVPALAAGSLHSQSPSSSHLELATGH